MNITSAALLDIRFASIDAVTFAVRPAPLAELLETLKKRLGPTPGVYYAEAAVLDLSAWTEADAVEHGLNLTDFKTVFETAGVNWVEVRSQIASFEDEAEQLKIRFSKPNEVPATIMDSPAEAPEQTAANQAEIKLISTEAPEINTEVAADQVQSAQPETRKTLVIDQAVRSGQKIYAQGADLVVMGQVSAGAEVIADGNVHVYGVLRGRALAGAAGDTQARILSTCFEAELVAVAGYYLTFEGGFPPDNHSKPSLVYLDQSQEPAMLRLKAINIR